MGKPFLTWLTLCLQILLFLMLAGLYLFQNRLIYNPVRYMQGEEKQFHRPIVSISYAGSYDPGGGKQTAFYVPPINDQTHLPAHVWIFFSGNSATALSYDRWLKNMDASEDGFLLIDYPGYGYNSGIPSPRAAEQSADRAVEALAERFSVTPLVLLQHMGAFGVSLGSAAALEFTVDHPAVHSLVMVAPFTSLRDMARLRFGFLHFLSHNAYDNEAALAKLAARRQRPYVAIFHGDADQTIPVTMSRQLALENTALVHYQEIRGADHGNVLYLAAPRIAAAMAKADSISH